MKKRYRKPKVKPNSLIFYYLASENINFSGGKMKSLIQELEERGYDLDTLRFTIEKKKI